MKVALPVFDRDWHRALIYWMGRGFRWGERALFMLALFTGIFEFPDLPALSLDPSWRIVLSRAFYSGAQFGHDIVFTYGPLGFLMGNTYDGAHFWVLIAWQLVKTVAFTAIILRAGYRLPTFGRWLYFGMFILIGVYFEDVLYLTIILLLGIESIHEREIPGARASVAIGAGLAWLSLIKFTNLLLAAAVIILVVNLHLRRNRKYSAFGLIGGYVGGVLVIWLVTQQGLRYLPDYLITSWNISRGYADSMNLLPPKLALWKALSGLVLLSIYLGLNLTSRLRKAGPVTGLLLIAAFSFLSWKHGFIRADGHMGGFFCAMVLSAIVAPILFGAARPLGAVRWLLLLLIVCVSIWGLDDSFTLTRSNAWNVFTGKITNDFSRLRQWKKFRASYDEEICRLLVERPLVKTREIVGSATIDVLGHESAIVCLHGFNYRPRPVFQSYSVYTPDLAQLNRDYFMSLRAPDFILQKIQTIDDRPVTIDDAAVLRLLPALYEYKDAEDGYLLWRRRPVPNEFPVNLTPLLSGVGIPGEELHIERFADKPLWLELSYSLSLAGSLRAFCYQPPIVHLRLTDAEGGHSNYRLPLSQALSGFLLTPLIDDASDFLMFASGQSLRRVRSFMVTIEEGHGYLFAERFAFSLTEISLPHAQLALGIVAREMRFSMFKTQPSSVSAFTPVLEQEIEGHSVIVAHAPSVITFDMPERPLRLTGAFGLMPGAYSEGGHTDGATFQVIWTDGPKREILFSRRLDPVRVSTDRGLQQLSLDLRPWQRGQLLLKIDPGPDWDNSWDWSAWSNIHIQQDLGK